VASHLRRGAPALLAAAALALGSSTAASAATWSHRDATGDVRSMDPDTQATAPAPGHRNTDVTSWRVRYAGSTVGVSITTARSLSRSGYAYLQVATPAAIYELYAGKTTSRTHLIRNGEELTCSGLRPRYDGTHHRLQITLPRRCIGAPRWVSIAASTVSPGTTRYFDDATRTGGDLSALAFSPRLAHD